MPSSSIGFYEAKTSYGVATLALGSRPRQRVARLQAKRDDRESCRLLGVQEGVRG